LVGNYVSPLVNRLLGGARSVKGKGAVGPIVRMNCGEVTKGTQKRSGKREVWKKFVAGKMKFETRGTRGSRMWR